MYCRMKLRPVLGAGTLVMCALALAACSSGNVRTNGANKVGTSTHLNARPRYRRSVRGLERRSGRPLTATHRQARYTSASYKLGRPYTVRGKTYVPRHEPNYDKTGQASWYGKGFQGRPTANGEIFDTNQLAAAHPTLPLPSLVRVTNLNNGRQVVVRVNDRGPFVRNRLIDLTRHAADVLGYTRQGGAPVRVEFLRLAD